MHVLITRPPEDAERVRDHLAALGVTAEIDPLLIIVPLDGPPLDLDGVQAILLTSANGARALARRDTRRDLPVLAVGEATAATARECGFVDVVSAGGDVAALALLARDRLRPEAGALLHVAGSAVAGDLAGLLGAHGFVYRRAVLYESRAADRLGAATRAGLVADRFDGVLFFSPRTAATFVRLASEEKLAAACERLTAYCLSAAVAARLEAIAWRAVRVAERPDLDSLVALLAAEARSSAAAEGSPKMRETDKDAADPTAPGAGEPRAAPPSPSIRVSGRSSGTRLVVGLALAAAVAAGVLYAAAPLWAPAAMRSLGGLGSSPLAPRLSGLEDRLIALEAQARARAALPDALQEMEEQRRRLSGELREVMGRLGTLELSIAALKREAERPPTEGPAVRDLTDRLNRIERSESEAERRLSRLEESAGREGARSSAIEELEARNRQLIAEVAEITQRLRAIERSEAGERSAAQARAFVLAVGQLRDAARTSGPFARELAALKAVAPRSADVERAVVALEARTAGVPNMEALRERFETMTKLVARAAVAAEGGWLGTIERWFAGLITVRRTDGAGDDADAALARAETRLRSGDLVGAVEALEALSGAAADAAVPWIAAARTRLDVEQALATLHVQALAMVGPS